MRSVRYATSLHACNDDILLVGTTASVILGVFASNSAPSGLTLVFKFVACSDQTGRDLGFPEILLRSSNTWLSTGSTTRGLARLSSVERSSSLQDIISARPFSCWHHRRQTTPQANGASPKPNEDQFLSLQFNLISSHDDMPSLIWCCCSLDTREPNLRPQLPQSLRFP